MTEQFAFQKIQRNSRAIEFYKSAPATLTGVVNGVSDEFFSRAGFPLDEDSRVGGGSLLHLLENRFEGSAIADDPLERTLGLVPRRVRNCCIICHKILLPGTAYDCYKPVCSHIKCNSDPFEQQMMIERFCKELDCTFSHRTNPHPGISMSRDEDDRNIAVLFFQPGLQLQARHLRHTDINDQARGLTLQIGFEKLFRGSEATSHKPSRLDEVA